LYTPLPGPQSKSGVENQSIGFKARSKKHYAKKGMQKWLLDHPAISKTQEAYSANNQM